MSKKAWFAVAVVVAVLFALALPVSNLLIDRAPAPELLARFDDPEAQEMIHLYRTRCMDCHSSSTVMPFYASFPVAKSIIGEDIKKARALFDLDREMFDARIGITEAALAKVQRETTSGAMPPASYLALHWNAGWSDAAAQQQARWARHVRARRDRATELEDPIYDRPVYPLKSVDGLDPKKVALGEAMYHDRRLSGDDTISCASCHDLTKGGTDQEPVSTGVGGQKGGINAPTTLNAAYMLAQFWDGRAADLVAQADGPPNNPIEMATNWEQVLGKLRQDEAVVADFQAAYGTLDADAIKDSIATYEKTLITTGDGLDRYLKGDKAALSDEQQQGWALFQLHGCDTCHVGAAMGGTSYELMGLHANYMSDRGNPTDADLGRFAVTKDEHDRHHFKVPTLRNVALTFPYFHDGSVAELEDAVRKMARYERGRQLVDTEVAQITAFLSALTGKQFTPPAMQQPAPRPDAPGTGEEATPTAPATAN